MEKVEFKLIKEFGPSILKVKIPNDIINKLNLYIDNIVDNKSLSNKLDHGEKLVGDVTQEFKLEEKIMRESGWGKFLANCTKKWIELELKKKITSFN